ncbi:MAG: hypothetical protein ACRDHF_09520 [Tepidiformaceae bacterium]
MNGFDSRGAEAALWLAVDVTGALALVAAACFALGVALARPRRALPFWLGASVGLFYLASDERFSLHERAGRWLYARDVNAPLGLNHVDDAVLLGVVGVAVAWTLLFGREVLVSSRFAGVLGLAAVVSAIALAIDGLAPVEGWAPRAEESVELLGQLLLLAAFAQRWAELRLPAMPLRASVPDATPTPTGEA